MLRVTDDLLELRHWAEERGGFPCRRLDGTLALCFGDDERPGLTIGWDEFESNFVVCREALVYDDAPGCNRHFIGTVPQARAWVAAADPSASGSAGRTP